MNRETQLRQDALLGAQAQEVLENEAFKTSCEQIEKEIIDKWTSSQSFEEREALWSKLQALKLILQRLQGMLGAKKYAEAELSRGK